MSTTRLMVLGVVRILQPAHGYLLRQELLSWDVQTWANVQPGSIYSALRTLTASGFLEEVGSQPTGSKAARTAYRLAATGEAEFLRLLREHLWQVDTIDGSWLMAGLSFMWALPRQEVRDALASRVTHLESLAVANKAGAGAALKNPEVPDHVQELFLVSAARVRGELTWTRAAIGRIERGDYHFADEPGPWAPASKTSARDEARRAWDTP